MAVHCAPDPIIELISSTREIPLLLLATFTKSEAIYPIASSALAAPLAIFSGNRLKWIFSHARTLVAGV
ncbi:hypothetical protein WS72_02120 [Burkholderia savannae]|uniref:Uncharacterized protein n=1 Tax=Burkholderia savannae TaxID=1637837 RepID=A0ABR5T9W3_9BURK|nr:hypothetical protein WS72_02120 [Burkholderia savannae]